MRTEKTLGEIIDNVESLPWTSDLYVNELLPNEPALVLDEENEELDSNGNVKYAVSKGIRLFLSIQAVQDVISNLKSQHYNPSLSQILEALRYYYDNDAFINING